MPRPTKPWPFRPWSKKRGQRISGHALRGVVGEAFFYVCLFLIGVFGLSLVVFERLAPDRAPDVSAEDLSIGLASWVFGTLSVAAILSGTAGLVLRLGRIGASSERRSAIATRARSRELVGVTADETPTLPNVPRGRALTESPGERLTYRLAPATPPSDRLTGPAVLTLLWNAVWFVLLAVVVSGFWTARPRWILTGLLVPFAWIGVWSFRFFVKRLRQFAGVGPTIVEISDHPLYPGGHYRLFVAQMGRLRLRRLRIFLVCEEETFFRQGTDVRVERGEACRLTIHQDVNVRVDPRSPWEQQLRVEVPESVMHSFVGAHNAIRWKVVVSGESRPWPSFCRSFPVVVHPPGLPPRRSPR